MKILYTTTTTTNTTWLSTSIILDHYLQWTKITITSTTGRHGQEGVSYPGPCAGAATTDAPQLHKWWVESVPNIGVLRVKVMVGYRTIYAVQMLEYWQFTMVKTRIMGRMNCTLFCWDANRCKFIVIPRRMPRGGKHASWSTKHCALHLVCCWCWTFLRTTWMMKLQPPSLMHSNTTVRSGLSIYREVFGSARRQPGRLCLICSQLPLKCWRYLTSATVPWDHWLWMHLHVHWRATIPWGSKVDTIHGIVCCCVWAVVC